MRVRVVLAGLLGAAAALLVSCGSSSGKLIPLADSGPLQSDFEAIERAALSGGGNCSATEAAIAKTEQDFGALPSSVDAGLRERLREGIAKDREDALALCTQALAQTVHTTSTAKTTPKTTTSTTTSTATTTPATTPATTPTSSTPSTTTPTTGSGGGTAAPPSESTPGASSGQGGGTGVGASSPQGEGAAGEGNGAGAGVGAGAGAGAGQEGAK
ncbi:MAG TPA: hypothetical protein VK272_12110 [Solirubrobacteraceae bacterium]|nr:hypothetical protein [Solirubrobacteraceae bacterium]